MFVGSKGRRAGRVRWVISTVSDRCFGTQKRENKEIRKEDKLVSTDGGRKNKQLPSALSLKQNTLPLFGLFTGVFACHRRFVVEPTSFCRLRVRSVTLLRRPILRQKHTPILCVPVSLLLFLFIITERNDSDIKEIASFFIG